MATWAGTENFESYANTNAINGLNGGSGWNGAWATVNSGITITSTQASEGTLSAAKIDGTTSESSAKRFLTTNAANGPMYISFRTSDVTASYAGGFRLGPNSSGNVAQAVEITVGQSSGNINALIGGAWNSLQAASSNTWYRMGIDWDNGGHPNQWRWNMNNGSWSSWLSSSDNNPFSTIDGIYFRGTENNAANNFYWDDISPTYTPPVANNGSLLTFF